MGALDEGACPSGGFGGRLEEEKGSRGAVGGKRREEPRKISNVLAVETGGGRGG